MGESFQDFEADFPTKVSLKILNSADFNSLLDLFLVYLMAINFVNIKLLMFCRHTATL